MTLDEVKAAVDQMTPHKRTVLAFYLKHRERANDPEYIAELARLVDACTGDGALSWDEAKRRLDEKDESNAAK
ncbi:MAG: hypothetical protein ACFBZ8_07540 [Opitutales bacterium]